LAETLVYMNAIVLQVQSADADGFAQIKNTLESLWPTAKRAYLFVQQQDNPSVLAEEWPEQYDFNAQPPNPKDMLADLKDKLQPWNKTGRFFNDESGARQGMWVMLHMLTAHSLKKGWGLNMDFYKKIVMHWNPCPTCRRRYWVDMEGIVTNNLPVEGVGCFHTSSSPDPMRDMWIYHNEVSMRQQAGMRRDWALVKPLGLASTAVADWTNKTKQMAKTFEEYWGLDKRWPSPGLCQDCWKNSCNGEADGAKSPLNVCKFLKCWNVPKVLEYLLQAYYNI